MLNKLFKMVKKALEDEPTPQPQQQAAPVETPAPAPAAPVAAAPGKMDPAVLKNRIASVIRSQYFGCEVQVDVPAASFSPNAHPKAKPISVLVSKNGQRVLAIAVVALNTYKSMPVKGTSQLVEGCRIPYLQFFVERENKEEYIADRVRKYLA